MAGAEGGKGVRPYRPVRAAFPIVSYILITIRRIKDKYTTAPVRPLVILLLARRLGQDDPRANCRGVYRACLVNIIANRYRRSSRESPRLEGRKALPCVAQRRVSLDDPRARRFSLLFVFSRPTLLIASPHRSPPSSSSLSLSLVAASSSCQLLCACPRDVSVGNPLNCSLRSRFNVSLSLLLVLRRQRG